MNDAARLTIESPSHLREWLAENHGQGEAVWLVTYLKSAAREKYVSRDEVLDELIAFGWIDGRRMKLDDKRTMQLIAPRKVQHWAKSYKDRAQRLIDEGRMAPPGLKSIDDGKASGLWNFMDDVDALIVPEDLRSALHDTPPAWDEWEALAPSVRRNTLRWVKLAKTDVTRAKRIAEAVGQAAKGEKVAQM
ncbi:MAG: YdeI/OmpD-associated family protein [Pseudomonadota bacterium]